MSTQSQAPWPNFTREEADAVSRVLLSNKVNYWTGEEGRHFEHEFAEFAGTCHAIALMNGTVALDLALHGLGIGSNNGGKASDEVIVTPRSFIASASTIVNAGAVPVFADVDEVTQNISPETIGPVLTGNTRGIICVHLAGWPCDMDAIRALTEGREIALIEDCAQAHGALYKGRPVGSLGDVAAWSFCQDKIMTTGGEGGMVTCNDETLWRRMWAFKDHGKSYEAVYEREHSPGFRWLHESIGTNWRMTEMQAVIGRIQLGRMPRWQQEREKNAAKWREKLLPYSGPNGPIRLTEISRSDRRSNVGDSTLENAVSRHAYYKYYCFVRPENLPANMNRDKVIELMQSTGATAMQGSCSEMYLEKAFHNTAYMPENRFESAKSLGETSIMLLTHPGYDPGQFDLTVLEQLVR